jgi:solute:Na+ symporter, SSS family
VPQFFEDSFPSWFAGIAFAAVAIGALVPAAIMSIAAANLFTRNIYRAYFERNASREREASVSKITSLVVKLGALIFVLSLDRQNAINFQLLGGIWILQTFPAIVFGLYTRWFHRWALLAGWAVGMIYGTVSAYQQSSLITKHFGRSLDEVPFIGKLGYIAMTAFVLNLIVTVVLTFVLRAMKTPDGVDETEPSDYYADEGDPRIEPITELTEDARPAST